MATASCHCGAITVELGFEPDSITECTCSVCRRYGARWAYATRRDITVHGNPKDRFRYSWGDATLEFCGCRICGCITHWEMVEKRDDSRVAVNARMLDPADTAGLRVRVFDGADTWRYLDE